MKPVEIPVFRGAGDIIGDIIFRAIKIPTKSSVLPLSLNDPDTPASLMTRAPMWSIKGL
jgi:hypothetical protein